MNSIPTFESIDYEELLESLNSDIADNTLTNDSVIRLVRQSGAVKVGDKEYFPIMDYFYESPELEPSLTKMKVLDAKKLVFEQKEKIDDEIYKETLDIIIGDLQAYTKNRSKRNDNDCFLLFIKDTKLPIMLFFEDEEPGMEVQISKVSDVLSEISECNH